MNDTETVASLWQEPEPDSEQPSWPALHLRDVFKIYRSGPVETVALRGLELRVEAGELIAIRGPSGCGKSTLLALAAALDSPSAGEVRIGEQSLGHLDDIELARLRATQLAIVFQSENLWPVLSARENVALVLRLAGVRDARAAAEDALGEFGLRERGGHVTGTLSGGEQQRVAIAAAFARKASLVLADEPTGELDPANEQIVLEALQHLRAQHSATVVLVTHSETVSASADRVIEMKDGRIL